MRKIIQNIYTKNNLFIFLLFCCLNCSTTTQAYRLSDLNTPYGKPNSFQSTSNWGLQWFIFGPALSKKHDLDPLVKDFTTEVRRAKATSHIIVAYECTSYWFAGPPFTLILTPINCEMAGYTFVEKKDPRD